MMVAKVTIVETPAFPVIDVHNHLGGGNEILTSQRVERYLAEMNAAGVRTVINLDGGWGQRLEETHIPVRPGLHYSSLDPFSGLRPGLRG
jgi:hypothetical protein